MTFPLKRSARAAVALAAISLVFTAPLLAKLPGEPVASGKDENGKPLRPPNLEPGEKTPWLYQGSNVPVDKAWTFGELSNGVRYAVRRNGVPPGQVSIRVRIDAGSMMETDAEQGFAHLLEHLTFRGSKYVPDGEAIRIWQRLGASFGSDSNAETTPTHTVYKLDLPAATPAGLDESMKILSGMIREPGLTGEAVTAEVPVVLAELRERSGGQVRVGDATRQLFFAGQKLSERSPIGKPETLNAATSQAVRGFHQRWYRPENTVIVIAGDVEPATLEALIKTHYGDWKVAGKQAPYPGFGAPDPAQPVARAVVEPGFPYLVSMGILRPWKPVNDTIAYNQQLLIDLVATQLINRRLEGRARGGGSFLQAQVNSEDVSRSVDGTFVSIVPIGDDWQAALADVRGVLADATTTAPTAEELARELSEFDAALAVRVETADTEAGAKQADDIVGAVDIRETIASPQTALDVFRGMKDLYTPERLLEATQRLFSGVTTRAILVSPQAVPDAQQVLTTALTRDVTADASARLAAAAVTFDDLPQLGAPGTVAATTDIRLLGIEVVELSNGVKAILYPNDAEVSKIMVKVRFGNGYQAFPADKPSLVWSGQAALVASGIGEIGQEGLDRLTTGRRIGFGFEVENDAFSFSADTRRADLEDQLKLFATKLAAPRWDENPVRRAKAGTELAYRSYSMSPQTVLERDLGYLTRNRDPRWKVPSPEDAAMLTPEAFRATWEPLLAQGPIEVMLFGDFDKAEAIAALQKTFGALPPRTAAPPVEGADTVTFPAPNAEPVVVRHDGAPDQAAAFLGWPTGGGIANVQESRQLEILTAIFNSRLFDQLRAQAGASYAPQVLNNWPIAFDKGGYVGVIGQLAPENVGKFFDIANAIAADLAAKPVSADELARATEPLRQLVSRASTGNNFWLNQLQGATRDPQRISALRSILPDYTVTTPERMQALAAKYLVKDKAWSFVVLPQDAPVPDSK
jgi:zinc protease